MKKRKRIGVLIADPGSDDSQRILEGIRSQCAQYDYDVLVFSPMVEVCHKDKDYLTGELNILELVSYDLLDGIILGTLSLTWDRVMSVLEGILKHLEDYPELPVVSLDYAIDGYDTVLTDDKQGIREMVNHMVRQHGCKRLCCLTGPKGYIVSEERANAFREQMAAEGLEVGDDSIHYGDFWITSGKAFAHKIISGEIDMPDAVICANDTMAIALTNELTENGIGVPGQVKVTGYDASRDAAFNTISITTYIPDLFTTAATAVNRIHDMIDDSDEKPIILPFSSGISIGCSCGCEQHTMNLQRFLGYNYNPQKRRNNPDGSPTCNDIQGLNSSYMLETLTGLKNSIDCLNRITDVTYLLQPYRRFYLCLRTDWSDTDSLCRYGYPEKMNCVMRCIPSIESETEEEFRYAEELERNHFDTSIMLPALYEEREMPVIFYFAPVHFGSDTMGYAVLQTELDSQRSADNVFQAWLRYVNNALHMVRVVSRLMDFSVRDAMTGLYNRRGMELEYRHIEKCADPDDCCLVFVIDMDRLKFINDTYGHESGDMGINTVAAAVRSITDEKDISVRTGGDEFVLIKTGFFTEEDGDDIIRRFENFLKAINDCTNLPFEITASIGYVCEPIKESDLETKIKEADAKMYAYKTEHKRARQA